MTLIVGIICKEAIVLAADSQTTKGMAKIPGAQKISVIEFLNGKALVAESGSASLSTATIQCLQNKASEIQIEDESTVAKTVESAIREIRSSLMGLHPNCTSPEEWKRYFFDPDNYFELMAAYYFDGKPSLYILNPAWCIPVRATSYFMTSGIAGDLANYILKEHTSRDMDFELASVIAIKTIEDAIEYVEGCGSPPRAALIRAPLPSQGKQLTYIAGTNFATVVVLQEPQVEGIAGIIASVEKESQNVRNKTIHEALRAKANQLFKHLFEDE